MSIRDGLKDALAFARGDTTRGTELHLIDVAKLREDLGLTQSQFADTFGFSVDTVRSWEQNRRVPRGPTHTLLLLIRQNPEQVRNALLQGKLGASVRSNSAPPGRSNPDVTIAGMGTFRASSAVPSAEALEEVLAWLPFDEETAEALRRARNEARQTQSNHKAS